MFRFAKPALALLACLTSHSALAGPADLPDASLSWRLAFGGNAIETGYGLALAYGSGELAGTRLVEIDVSDRAALARIAGLPLLDRSYRAQQNEALPAPEPATGTPWYSRRWVWWTLGGLAATAAAASGGGTTIDVNDNNNNSSSSRGCTGVSGNAGDQDLGCTGVSESGNVVSTNDDGDVCAAEGWGDDVPDGCVPTSGNGFAAAAGTWLHERADTTWLDAGTGRMGDLVAR